MTNWQKFICILLSLCMIGLLFIYLPGFYPMPMQETGMVDKLFHQFPVYGYMKNQAVYAPTIEDEYTYDKIVEANAKYLREQVEDENQLAQEKQTEKETQNQEKPSKDTPSQEKEKSSSGEAERASAPVEPQIDITREQLENYDYLLGNFFIVDSTTAVDASRINASGLLDVDMSIEKNQEVPQILIYHTHSQEGFADSREGNPQDTVAGVGDYLTELLTEQYGYQVIHNTDTFDVVNGQIDRNSAYDYSLAVVEQILQENPSIEVVIDLHRDGVAEDRRLVTEVNGKPTANFMFFNGLSYSALNGEVTYLPNPYVQENLAFSFQLNLEAARYYPGLSRNIYLSSLRYNLHVRPRAILLEAGAQTNTVQEVKNAMDPFAQILDQVLQGSGKDAD